MRRVLPASEWRPRGVEELEPNAEEVVRSRRNMCVTAGPGAGKTELLAQRASFLLETGACPYPRRILAISFKRDAAKNLHERVLKRSGETLGRRFDSFTFDAFAKGILDQFLGALPPELRPTPDYDLLLRGLRRPEIEEILFSMRPPAHLGATKDLQGLAHEAFFKDKVPRASFREEPSTLERWAAREFWRVLLRGGERSQLTFQLITRLAGELLRNDARLSRAYRTTYSHAFLDEFQDTTGLQYWLTCILFRCTPVVLTAVGDPRQRIMGWAGAMRTAFGRFERDFGAKPTRLHRNHRASEEIAPVVRFLADQLGEVLEKSEDEMKSLLPGSGPPPGACAAYVFTEEQREAEWIADEVGKLLAGGVHPRDISILVRMKAHEYCEHIIAALRVRGLSARVEDQMQDLLTEPAIEACVLGLRALACERPRHHWAMFRELVADCRGIGLDDEREWAAMEHELEFARQRIRAAYTIPTFTAAEIRSLIAGFIEPFVGAVRRRHGQYRRGSLYETSLQQLANAIASAPWTRWDAVLDDVEGLMAVPILTIHKSKGLEYHAVFFVGLEDGAFWNFRRDPDEESNAFFVALSRAKARVAFTFSENRTRCGRIEPQTASGIAALYELMTKAGVQLLRPMANG